MTAISTGSHWVGYLKARAGETVSEFHETGNLVISPEICRESLGVAEVG